MSKLLAGLFAIGVLVYLIMVPFISVLALNTLFGLGIPYTLGTYFASIWMHFVFMLPFMSMSKTVIEHNTKN
jgi:hypothetical protein